ncbi:MAG: hypothetical protein EKK41_12775 [Hyphomicrobiales bacterium]|nr:MAG: hypothetical protein EKK41_12775 [Hyphomicrobiales bacterium]
MTETSSVITLEKRRFAALIAALLLARYAMLQPRSRIVCPPHTSYGLAHTIDRAIADARKAEREVHS